MAERPWGPTPWKTTQWFWIFAFDATWTKALILCGFVTNDRRDKSEADATIREVMSLIITAQEQLWADVRISGGV